MATAAAASDADSKGAAPPPVSVPPSLDALQQLPVWDRVGELQKIHAAGTAPKGSMLEYMAATVAPIGAAEQARRSQLQQHLDTPQENGDTANPEWLKLRHCTGSTTPGGYGVSKYKTAKQQVVAWVWPELEQYGAACKYGNLTEDEVEDTFLEWRRSSVGLDTDADGYVLQGIEIDHYGIVCKRACPVLGHSPDGVAVETWKHPETGETKVTRNLCEYKSRWYYRDHWDMRLRHLRDDFDRGRLQHLRDSYGIRRLVDYRLVPADMYATETVAKSEPPRALPVPSQYYGQVQHGMKVLGDDGFCDKPTPANPTFTWFAVWAPAAEDVPDDAEGRQQFIERPSGFQGGSVTATGRKGTVQVTKVPYDAAYTTAMHDCVLDMYLQKVLPARYLKSRCKLRPGEIVVARRRDRLRKSPGSDSGSGSGSGSGSDGGGRGTHAARLQRMIDRKKAATAAAKNVRDTRSAQRRVAAALHNDFGFTVKPGKRKLTASQTRMDTRQASGGGGGRGGPKSKFVRNDFGFQVVRS
jgi:hypothetical protein